MSDPRLSFHLKPNLGSYKARTKPMRKIYTLLFMLCIGILCFAEHPTVLPKRADSYSASAPYIRQGQTIERPLGRRSNKYKSPSSKPKDDWWHYNGLTLQLDSISNEICNGNSAQNYDQSGRLVEIRCYSQLNEPIIKDQFLYDEGHEDRVYYIWSKETSSWVPESKNEIKYDEEGNMIIFAQYNWSAEKDIWVGYYKKLESEYDTYGNITKMKVSIWSDETDSWQESYNTYYKYDNTKYIYNSINHILEILTESEQEQTKEVYTHNEIGLPSCVDKFKRRSNDEDWHAISHTYYNYDYGRHCWVNTIELDNNNEWVEAAYNLELEYDESGRERYYAYYPSRQEDFDTEAPRKEIYEYDDNGNITLWITYTWSKELNDWLGKHKQEYIYDEDRSLLMEAQYTWSPESNCWEGQSGGKKVYLYDQDGHLNIHGYRWDQGWILWYKEIHLFDSLIYASTTIEEREVYIRDNLLESYSIFSLSDDCTMGVVTYYYSDYYAELFGLEKIFGHNYLYFTVIGNDSISSVELLPNIVRTQDKFILINEPNNIQVYDIMGRLLYSGFTDRVEMQKAGMYIVKVDNQTTKVTLK